MILGSSRATVTVPSRYSPAGTVAGSFPVRAKTDPSRLIAVACISTALGRLEGL